ncbi:MAG: hypothetical protein DRQ37_02520 [Gammaproteobacteria bacterium]|nr:MAG: hypothetical protein DRQ37_02520 [Gammaproteobacteria bacterium]
MKPSYHAHVWKPVLTTLLVSLVLAPVAATAAQLRVAKVVALPAVDGRADDPAWSGAQPLVVQDAVAGIPIELRAVYSNDEIFVLARYPDDTENRVHKALVWNAERGIYEMGPTREDTLVLKWNMSPYDVDLTLSSEQPYKADIWFWKANRTDSIGFADDKYHFYSSQRLQKAKVLISNNGALFYLKRQGDAGRSAYKSLLYSERVGDTVRKFENRTPEASRADAKAKGRWHAGEWTIEFRRRLNTGHGDDLQFDPTHQYQFGVSRFEVAGRKPDPTTEQPNHGAGEIGKVITLVFEQ